MYGTNKIYRTTSPITDKWHVLSCQEADCKNYQNGWKVRVDGLPAGLLQQVTNSGRVFQRVQISADETWLIFKSEQQCFEKHLSPNRPAYYYSKDRNGVRTHTKAEFWIEEHQENLDAIRDRLEKG
jgi:hypothetical protein